MGADGVSSFLCIKAKHDRFLAHYTADGWMDGVFVSCIDLHIPYPDLYGLWRKKKERFGTNRASLPGEWL